MKTIKVGLLGFGNAGQAFAQMLIDKMPEIIERYQTQVLVTAISTRSKGCIHNPGGIDLERALGDIRDHKVFSPETPGYGPIDNLTLIKEGDFDVVCELTPLNIHTGQPAIDHIKTALQAGKHVITANKGPIAWAYEEIRTLAQEKGLAFFYETTVMDGTPIFNLVEHTLKLCKVERVEGILNSTTNFILEEMAKERDYDDIIKEGRERGFIEADSAMDIEGYDAAAKTTALLNVLMGANIKPTDVDRKGIEDIGLEDIKRAQARGKVIKLLCLGYLEDGKVKASVQPVEVDQKDILASIDSTTSIVSIYTDLMGKLSIVEHAPEIEQTAYGVFGDLLRVIEFIG